MGPQGHTPHKETSAAEGSRRPWLEAKSDCWVTRIPCLGVTAAQSVFGKTCVNRTPRLPLTAPLETPLFVTAHPSPFLRGPGSSVQREGLPPLVGDLRLGTSSNPLWRRLQSYVSRSPPLEQPDAHASLDCLFCPFIMPNHR